MKKSKTPAEKPVSKSKSKAKTEQPTATVVTGATPEKSSSAQKTPKKTPVVAPQAIAERPEMATPERVGLTAGSIWRYLNKNGATAVAKLVRELQEEEKIIQRSIGWLAQEGKVSLDIIDKIETIGLKN
ncbi:conserved hypothetical protein [Candidatus Methylobacter favarea]|uniref:Winged helix-turn-helix domain-containing protein n=1 Tax=Candidatus Methylobacter favarea TaxID=2707345 RepID=A0A8S0XFL2_9GAMM|nr:winged helix-turn-helix domain-containing protein [Candidatus Methylobacter favarea]CAA9890477.1 conserved hypothetical protein [Candidatus Methylobacter favarea]